MVIQTSDRQRRLPYERTAPTANRPDGKPSRRQAPQPWQAPQQQPAPAAPGSVRMFRASRLRAASNSSAG